MVNEHPGEDGRALGVELVHELRDNAKVATATTNPEEKVSIDSCGGGVGGAGGGDYYCLDGDEGYLS
jgi:hypothetical protein